MFILDYSNALNQSTCGTKSCYQMLYSFRQGELYLQFLVSTLPYRSTVYADDSGCWGLPCNAVSARLQPTTDHTSTTTAAAQPSDGGIASWNRSRSSEAADDTNRGCNL